MSLAARDREVEARLNPSARFYKVHVAAVQVKAVRGIGLSGCNHVRHLDLAI